MVSEEELPDKTKRAIEKYNSLKAKMSRIEEEIEDYERILEFKQKTLENIRLEIEKLEKELGPLVKFK